MIVPQDLAEQLSAYPEDPVGFAHDVLNVELDRWQQHFLEALVTHQRVAVASCTGAGKDFGGAVGILWFLSQFFKAYCPCTANSQDQVEKVLWKQFAELVNSSNGLDEVFEWQATSIRHRDYPAEWLAFAKTSAKKISHGERFAEGSSGHHAENMLILLDEASGIDEEFWAAYEPTLTGPNNKIVAIGNPNRLSGSFYQIFYNTKIAGFWSRMRVGGKPHPNVDFVSERANASGNHEYLLTKYGRSHPIVQSKVFGQHPTLSSNDTGYSFEEIQAARANVIVPSEDDAVQIGVDVARFGDDETVFTVRRGRTFRQICFRKLDSTAVVDHLFEIADTEPDITRPDNDHRGLAVIDETGVGGGVVDLARRRGYKAVRGVSFGGSARHTAAYRNLAAEMWLEDLKAYFLCAHCARYFEAHLDDAEILDGDARPCPKFLPMCDLPDDDDLMAQLISRKYDFTGKGEGHPKTKIRQRFIESKDDMKARGLESPDRADSLCLSVVRPKTVRAY